VAPAGTAGFLDFAREPKPCGPRPRVAYPGAVRLLAVLLGIVFSLVLVEVGLRVASLLATGEPGTLLTFLREVEAAPSEDPLYRESDIPGLVYEFVPKVLAGSIQINSAGFRGREVDATPPAGITRIAFIGDSETFARHLPARGALSGAVEEILNEARGETRFECLNFGVPGYNTAQEWVVLTEKALGFDPQIVVLYYVFNDAAVQSAVVLLNTRTLSRSYLYLLTQWLSRARDTGMSALLGKHRHIVPYYLELHGSEHGAASRSLLRKMGRVLHEQGIRFLVVIAPELVGFVDFGRYPYDDIHSQLAALASAEVEVVDPLPSIAAMGLSPRQLWASETDPHKNAQATLVIASDVGAAILRSAD